MPVLLSALAKSHLRNGNESETGKNACPTLATFASERLLPVMLKQPVTAQPWAALTERAKLPALTRGSRIVGPIAFR
jgi:hypothetical protein